MPEARLLPAAAAKGGFSTRRAQARRRPKARNHRRGGAYVSPRHLALGIPAADLRGFRAGAANQKSLLDDIDHVLGSVPMHEDNLVGQADLGEPGLSLFQPGIRSL